MSSLRQGGGRRGSTVNRSGQGPGGDDFFYGVTQWKPRLRYLCVARMPSVCFIGKFVSVRSGVDQNNSVQSRVAGSELFLHVFADWYVRSSEQKLA
mgnify:CR=1 FL=1